ncbi:PREDICTED: free fatty acid receptor 4 [Nanorana parkeri]|uniref:free fatty acid receptor 4 n=1 Tax=Nanorana parkeri TaxID=125878 RepID=UPI0008543E8C|nr:PREDICTED: free fatty acid receptor 4 [Nanorana parkeri]
MGQLLISYQDEQYGNHTHFAFYTEFNKTLEEKVVETIFLSLVFVFSWFSNVCAIVLLIRKKRLVTSNCFVLNLFCSDLLFVSMIPFILVVRWTENWILGEFVCHLLFYVMCLSGSVILISLSAVSLERMICIMKVTQTTTCNVKVVVLGLVIIWVFSAMTALPLCLFFKVIPKTVNDEELKICTLLWPTLTEEITWDVSFVLLDFIIPGLGIIVSYTKIYKITRDIRQRMISSTAYSENHQIRVSQCDYKLFRTLFLLMISFFVMWTPVFIMVLLLLIQNLDIDFRLSPTCFFWISLFTFCNSIVNPVLYNINLCRQKWCQIVFCCSTEESTDTETTIKKNENQNCASEIK